MSRMYWERFEKTGSVSDYLAYKADEMFDFMNLDSGKACVGKEGSMRLTEPVKADAGYFRLNRDGDSEEYL